MSHPGANASIKVVTEIFVWPRIKSHIRLLISPHSFPFSDDHFIHVHLDITSPLTFCEGHTYLLTCVDRFSRFYEALLILDLTAKTKAKEVLHI